METLRAERHALVPDERFRAVVDCIRNGDFGWTEFFAPILASVEGQDHYLVANDFPSYLDIQVRPTHPSWRRSKGRTTTWWPTTSPPISTRCDSAMC